jgi:hypothetical protein
VKSNRFDYTDLGPSLNFNQHDIGLIFLDRDIVTSYPFVSTIPFPSLSRNIGRTNNGALSFSSLFVGPATTLSVVASAPFYYASTPEIIEPGDAGGPTMLLSPSPHVVLGVNSATNPTTQFMARVDLLAGWIQERVAARSCGPSCPNPLDQSTFFIRQMFLDVLGREPDASGQAFHQNVLNACNGNATCLASTRVDIARGFMDSPENRAQYPELNPSSASYNSFFVKHCYWSFMGRQPDAGGFSFFMNILSSTGDYTSVIRSFITSAEFRLRFGAP